MSFPSRERSSSLFIISEGQFYSKPSLKLERLEKDYSDLKRKENEDGIELRRLRSENLLLKQRIANLEKESATLAHKLVQDKVVWAQEVEQLYAVRTRLSLTLRQLRETQNQLHDAENTIDELSKKNQISTDQIRRVGENNKELRELLKEITQDKNVLHTQINVLARKLDDAESTRQAEAIIARIKDAEGMQQMAELRRKLAEIDIQKVEKLAMGQIRDQANCYPLVTSLCDLQDQQPLECQLNVPDVCVHRGHQGMTDSRQWASNSEAPTDCRWAISSDDEFDALIKDSESLERTLSDIIEGRQNSSKTLKRNAEECILFDSIDLGLESNISDMVNYVPVPNRHRTNMAVQLEAGACGSRQYTGNAFTGLTNIDDISDKKVAGIGNVDDISDEKVAGRANVDDISDAKVAGIANIDAISDDDVASISNATNTFDDKVAATETADDGIDHKFVGVTNIGYADDKTTYKSSFDDVSEDNTACVANVGCADYTVDGSLSDVDVTITDDINGENIVDITIIDDINDENIVGATIDDINDENIVGATIDDINDNKKFDVLNAEIADDKIVGVAKDDVVNDKMVGVAKDNITNENSVCLSNDQIRDKALAGRANDHDIRDEKVIVAANAFPVDVAQCESRFKHMSKTDHDDGVYDTPGGSVVHLFGYKGEATLLLKESTV